jgi:DNA-binding MarR family transcriptional regulator
MKVHNGKMPEAVRTSDQSGEQILDPDDYIPGTIALIYNKLSAEVSQKFRRIYGIGLSDWRVLAYLGVYGQCTATEISRAIALDKAATSRSITVLKKFQYVLEAKNTKKNIQISISIEGRNRYSEILVFVRARQQAMLHGLSAADRKDLSGMLRRLHGNVERVFEVSPPPSLAKSEVG